MNCIYLSGEDILIYSSKTHYERLNLNKPMAILFAIALVVLPFNAISSRSFILGELATEAATYPIILMIILYLIKAIFDRINYPKHISIIFLLCFLGWLLISGAVNIQTITDNFTKGRSGYNRYILQLIVFIFMLFSALAIYQFAPKIWHEQTLIIARRYILYSFLVAGIYSLFEIPYILGAEWTNAILVMINPLIHGKDWSGLYETRLRSVSGEASWFAMYMSFTLPWLLSYAFIKKQKQWIYISLNSYAFLLIFFTYSRTAYVITTAELIGFIGVIVWFADWRFKKSVFIIIFGVVIATTAFMVSVDSAYEKINEIILSLTGSSEKTHYHMSNVVRFGMQTAGWRMAFENPLFGVGFGQFGFHMHNYIPLASLTSPEMIDYVFSSQDTPWPPAHGLFHRIAGETGFVGLALWLSVWLSLLWSVWRQCRLSVKRGNLIDLALFISMVGTFMVGFNTGSIRFFGYWFVIALAWVYLSIVFQFWSFPSDPAT